MNERIENYFEQKLSEAEKVQFETDLKSDPELADSVAFYLVSKKAAANNAGTKKLTERHVEWQSLKKQDSKFVTLRTWYNVAAAVAMLAFGLAWYLLMPGKQDIQQLADVYISENFTTLSLQMGSTKDSIQLAIGNYNNKKYTIAVKICEDVLTRDPQNAEAKKLAGIISLKILNYDKAIAYFQQLGAQQNLYANPGKFYEAVTLLKRGLPSDKEKAKKLLQEVIDGDLEGKEEAVKWMK